jgi:hypothetical protein
MGYSWEIEAPEELTHEDVEGLHHALADFSDTPQQSDLNLIIANPSMYLEDYIEGLDATKLTLISQVQFVVDCVHRETSTQEFKEI